MSAHLAREPEPQCLPPSTWVGLPGAGEASKGVSPHSFLWRQRVPSSGRRVSTNSKHNTGDTIYPRLGIAAAGEYSPTWCCLERKLLKDFFFFILIFQVKTNNLSSNLLWEKKMVFPTSLCWRALWAGYPINSQGRDHLFFYCWEVPRATGLATFRSSKC